MINLSQLSANGSGGATNGTSSTPTSAGSQVSQDDFLKLMVTQLQNQDPLSPMSNGEFLTQIAQFTSASGIDQLQSSFQQFQTSMQTNQALQAASLVGRQVIVQSDQGYLPANDQMDATVHLSTSVGNLTVSVLDNAGQLVRKVELGQHTAGDVAFQWDGKDDQGQPMPAGSYQLKAQADVNGQSVSMPIRSTATVNSVMLGSAQGPQLDLEGLGTVSLDAITEVK